MTFYGIADAHGLESFKHIPFRSEVEGFSIDPKELSVLGFRAEANRHRHAVVFQTEISKDDAQMVLSLFQKGDYIQALQELKDRAESVSLMRSPGAEKSWKMIPNPDLDPYHG